MSIAIFAVTLANLWVNLALTDSPGQTPRFPLHLAPSVGAPFGLTKVHHGSLSAKGGGKPMDLNFKYLFTSFDGRINRAKYWAGTIILAIVSIVAGFIIGAIFGSSTLGAILVALVTIALFYPGYAVAAKRFQD